MQEAISGVVSPQNVVGKLGLPDLTLVELSCGCADEKPLCAWLQEYERRPYVVADQHRLAGLLSSMFNEMSQLDAPAIRRLAMLELLRGYALPCTESMALDKIALAGAQTVELRKTIMAAVRLLQQMAMAYSSVAVQLAKGEVQGFFTRERLARSLQRAVDSYRRQVQITALFYLAVPDGCWRNMQLLVQLAQLHQLDGKRVKDPHHDARKDSVAGAYLQASLFASTNFPQLVTADIERLWAATHDWSRAAKIVGSYSDSKRALLASLSQDQSPVPASRLGSGDVDLTHFTAPRGWKVDISKVLEKMGKQLRKNRDLLFERVLANWSTEMGRCEERSAAEQGCEIIFGIAAICHQLTDGEAHDDAFSNFFRQVEKVENRLRMAVDTVDFYTGNSLNEYDVALPCAPRLHNETRSKARQPQKVNDRYLPLGAQVLNSSDRGIGLKLPLQACGRMRVGELIGIRLASSWQVATVRWQYAMPDHCRAGVEVLALDAVPVQVRRHTQSGNLSAPIAGLLVKLDKQGRPAIILPTPLFKCYDTVQMLAKKRSHPVTLQRQTLATGSFARFEFV